MGVLAYHYLVYQKPTDGKNFFDAALYRAASAWLGQQPAPCKTAGKQAEITAEQATFKKFRNGTKERTASFPSPPISLL